MSEELRAALEQWATRNKPWTGPTSMTAEDGYNAAISEVVAMLNYHARPAASQGDEGLLLAKYPKRAFATEAGDRLLAMNAGRDSAVVQWLTNDIRAIEQEEYDKIRAALAAEEERRG